MAQMSVAVKPNKFKSYSARGQITKFDLNPFPSSVRLYWPLEAIAMRTAFRDSALRFIYQTVLILSDGRLQSAAVEVWSNPGEEDSLTLNLTLEVDADRNTIKALRYETVVKVTEWLKDRAVDEKADYGRRIYFGVVPSYS